MSAESTLWNGCLRELQAELPEQQFSTWIRPLQAVEKNGTLTLLAPNRFVVDWLQQHHLQRILQLVEERGGGTELVVEVGSRTSQAAAATVARPRAPAAAILADKDAPSPVASRLNPGFTFETFVEGKSNQLARAAASQVGANPGKSYNPLFYLWRRRPGQDSPDARGWKRDSGGQAKRPCRLRALGTLRRRYGSWPAAQYDLGVQADLPLTWTRC